eukprot:CAMPEP_0176251228 /NCGR_PEP_ID=MMETSP0121_2-20121125/34892_1 /TAXON_ID=160619 /ORGANISM="Kryptoperidinium foliaceum, Strain CCMP 1326" /LENGTH=225 /DNA_ID=CAMNT_0017590967 /DNA_START=298 /DNA_END=973 /DNA_ORIENTATION=+
MGASNHTSHSNISGPRPAHIALGRGASCPRRSSSRQVMGTSRPPMALEGARTARRYLVGLCGSGAQWGREVRRDTLPRPPQNLVLQEHHLPEKMLDLTVDLPHRQCLCRVRLKLVGTMCERQAAPAGQRPEIKKGVQSCVLRAVGACRTSAGPCANVHRSPRLHRPKTKKLHIFVLWNLPGTESEGRRTSSLTTAANNGFAQRAIEILPRAPECVAVGNGDERAR